MTRRLILWGLVAVWMVSLAGCGDVRGGVAAGASVVPIIRGGTPTTMPAWAFKQREVLELNATIAREFEKGFLNADGSLRGTMQFGGGTSAPDDIMETVTKLPLLYCMGGDADTWRIYWKAYQGLARQCAQLGMSVNEMNKNLDWHHNGEEYQGFWIAALIAHDDPEYRRLAYKFASFFDGTNPDVPNYDPKSKVIRSINCGGAGPVLHATVADWDERGREFWEEWRACAHDGPINLTTTNFGTVAYLVSGDANYKQRTMEYIDAWRDRAKANGGIVPSIVNHDGTVPKEWWGGVMGWNFRKFGGLFMVSAGLRAAWGNALLMTGDASYYDNLRTLCDELWKHHTEKQVSGVRGASPQTQYFVPSYYDGKEWTGILEHPHAQGVYVSNLANIYLATMKREDLDRLMTRVHSGVLAAGHAPWQEGGYEHDWIAFLQGQDATWPTRELDRIIKASEANIAEIRKESAMEPSARPPGWPRHWSWVGPVVNQRTGGTMPLWHGQLLLCRLFYFDPQRANRPGMPEDCAALVTALADDSVSVTLVNMNPEQKRKVLVQAGAYSEHQFVSVQSDKGAATAVNATRFAVELPAGSELKLVIKMKRYANPPTVRG